VLIPLLGVGPAQIIRDFPSDRTQGRQRIFREARSLNGAFEKLPIQTRLDAARNGNGNDVALSGTYGQSNTKVEFFI
jgi:hypothetical protein